MKVIDCVQYSPEWWDARRGIPTASQFNRIVTPAKLKLSAQADSYIDELIAARVSFTPPVTTDRPMNAAMRHGVECEPDARNWYALEGNHDVQQVGFCLSDDGRLGCSPDGLVGDDGGVELKCPQLETQVRYLREGVLPTEYALQVHGSLIVTGRAWWDFVSYHVDAPPFVVRVEPNETTARLRAALVEFCDRYDAEWASYVERFGDPRRAG